MEVFCAGMGIFIGIIIGVWLKSVVADRKFSRINGNWFRDGNISNLVTDTCQKSALTVLSREIYVSDNIDIDVKVYYR